MKTCTKCGTIGAFRQRKNHSGNYYEISVCWECERKQKKDAENKRYKNLNTAQKTHHNNLAKAAQKKENYKIWHRIWQKERERNNLPFLLKRRVGALLRNSVSKHGKKTFDVLGYTPNQFIKHMEGLFESWMNWDNWGVYNPETWNDFDSSTWTWQVDHIKPVSSFDIKDINDPLLKKCWALENLRPLSAKENILKGNKQP